MASLNLSQDELKAVEQTRQRLSQLSNSIGSLKNDVMHQYPLPPLESLQASADILQHNLRTLVDTVTQHNDLFTRVAVHPSTNYPGRTQESILFQLLRKKADPDVANSMDEGRKTLASLAHVGTGTSGAPPGGGGGATATAPGNGNHSNSNTMQLSVDPNAEQDAAVMARIEAQESELEGIWGRAQQACHERVMQYAQFEDNDPYTAEEREAGVESVRTGLRRPLDSDDEDEGDEDDEDEDNNGGGGGVGDDDDDDLMIIDRPHPPPAPAIKAHDVEGASLESILRLGVRGEFFAV